MFSLLAPQGKVTVDHRAPLRIRYQHGGPPLSPGGCIRLGYEHHYGAAMPNITDAGKPGYVTAQAAVPVSVHHTHSRFVRSITHFAAMGQSDVYVFEIRIDQTPLQDGQTIDIQLGATDGDRPGFLFGRSTAMPFVLYYHIDVDGRFAARSLHPDSPGYVQYISEDGSEIPDWEPTGISIDLLPGPAERIDACLPSQACPAAGPQPTYRDTARGSVPLQAYTTTPRHEPAEAGCPVVLALTVYDRFGNPVPSFSDHIESMDEQVSLDNCDFTTNEHGSAELMLHVDSPQPPRRYTFRLGTLGMVRTNPIEITDQPRQRTYWGELHGHSCLSDGGARGPEYFYTYARHTRRLDFAGMAEHVFGLAVRGHWQRYLKACAEALDEGQFVSILGYEFLLKGYGHRNIYFPGEDAPLVMADYQPGCGGSFDGEDIPVYRQIWDSDVPKTPTPQAALQYLEGRDYIWTAHHYYGRLFEGERKLLTHYEAASEWGISEADVGQQNNSTTTVRDVFADRLNVQLTGGSDDHRAQAGFAGCAVTGGPIRYPSGLTAVLAEGLTRADVYAALKAGRCYATTGARILIRPDVTYTDSTLSVRLDIFGTDTLERIWVFKNDQQAHELLPAAEEHITFCWTDEQFCADDVCYIRIRQHDGELAWINPRPLAQPGTVC